MKAIDTSQRSYAVFKVQHSGVDGDDTKQTRPITKQLSTLQGVLQVAHAPDRSVLQSPIIITDGDGVDFLRSWGWPGEIREFFRGLVGAIAVPFRQF